MKRQRGTFRRGNDADTEGSESGMGGSLAQIGAIPAQRGKSRCICRGVEERRLRMRGEASGNEKPG